MVALPILEVYLIVQVGQLIGVWWTLAILVGEALLGAWLMRREGARAWKALNEAFNSGRMPTGELADAALVLVGGVLLMLPGFITDIFGLLFLLPFTRPLARKVLAYAVARRMSRMGVLATRAPGRNGDRGRDRAGSTAAPPGRRVPSSSPARSMTGPAQAGGHVSAAVLTDDGDQSPPRVVCTPRAEPDVPHLGHGALAIAVRRRVVRTQLTGAEKIQPLGQQILELGDAAALAEHVPVRTHRLLLLGLRPDAVRPQRLPAAAWALPHRRNSASAANIKVKW